MTGGHCLEQLGSGDTVSPSVCPRQSPDGVHPEAEAILHFIVPKTSLKTTFLSPIKANPIFQSK